MLGKKLIFKKTKINITVNAGILPLDHWLLNKNISGGRIIGEFCHFIDLSLTLLNHTKLLMLSVYEEINIIKIPESIFKI